MNCVLGVAVCALGVGLFLSLAQAAGSAAGLEAEMVIYNGKIVTADSPDPNNFTIAQAAAIYKGKFVLNQNVCERGR